MSDARCLCDSSKTCVRPEGQCSGWAHCQRFHETLRQQDWGPEEPAPPQERDAPWWVVALVWVVVALAGFAALRRLLS